MKWMIAWTVLATIGLWGVNVFAGKPLLVLASASLCIPAFVFFGRFAYSIK